MRAAPRGGGAGVIIFAEPEAPGESPGRDRRTHRRRYRVPFRRRVQAAPARDPHAGLHPPRHPTSRARRRRPRALQIPRHPRRERDLLLRRAPDDGGRPELRMAPHGAVRVAQRRGAPGGVRAHGVARRARGPGPPRDQHRRWSQRRSDVCVYDPMSGTRAFFPAPPDVGKSPYSRFLGGGSIAAVSYFMLLAADLDTSLDMSVRIRVRTLSSPDGKWGPLKSVVL
ncbi:unnamed protein product, partial [Urochloa humidicola]